MATVYSLTDSCRLSLSHTHSISTPPLMTPQMTQQSYPRFIMSQANVRQKDAIPTRLIGSTWGIWCLCTTVPLLRPETDLKTFITHCASCIDSSWRESCAHESYFETLPMRDVQPYKAKPEDIFDISNHLPQTLQVRNRRWKCACSMHSI